MDWLRASTVLATIQVLAVSSLAPLQARAQESGPATPGGKFTERCSDNLYDRAARRGPRDGGVRSREMPPGIQAHQSDLVQQLHPDNLPAEDRKTERGCMPVAEAWPHHANLYLLPVETIVREFNDEGGWEDTPRSLALGLVRVSGDAASVSVVAKTQRPLKHTGKLDRFDFASYRLNEHETAFGLRSYFSTTYAGGGGRDQILELFRVKDGVIEPILRTLMASSNFVHGEQRGDPKGAVIRVLATKTNGVFDLEKSVRGSRSAIFRWNGHAYETHDQEPVKCLNDPCDDIKRELTQGNRF